MAVGDELSGENLAAEASKGFVIRSGVRSGLKREFDFAIRAQSELPPTLGRLRSRTSPSPSSSSINDGSSSRRFTRDSETESGPRKSPMALLPSQIESCIVADDVQEARTSDSEKESNRNELKIKIPTNMRELLETGLLEGLPVKYTACTKKRPELKGVLRGTGILCYCASCKGSQVISAHHFGEHAGNPKKSPPDFICLTNGKTIRDILEACKYFPVNILKSAILKLIYSCHKCKGNPGSICDLCLQSSQPQTTPSPTGSDGCISTSKYTSSQKKSTVGRLTKNTSKYTSSQKKSTVGRLTKKNLGLHKLVFMGDTLPAGMEVSYYVQGQQKLKGCIKDSGIFCFCCDTVVSPSLFESHAGQAQRRKPYNYIYTSNGVSLHELSVSLSKGRKFSASKHDDLCHICENGENLLLCDLCPRAFHTDCIGLSSIPEGDWCCRYCQDMHQREKHVEYNNNAIAAGRVAGVDPIEQIFKRCIRIVETLETNVGGCVLCRCHDFSRSDFGPRTVLLCDQCEKEYHVGCLKDHKRVLLEELPKGDWFCCSDCSWIHVYLQNLFITGDMLLQDVDSDIIKRKHKDEESNKVDNVDAKWRLIRGKNNAVDKLVLSEAVSIFHESFSPITESNGQDLIPDMVYGRRSTSDYDFGGMYCAILTVDSSVVSVAILRVLGSDIAELPLVATKSDSQGQGFFRSLFACIEKLLVSLKVKHLVLPAAEEAESIWINKFGFTKISLDKVPYLAPSLSKILQCILQLLATGLLFFSFPYGYICQSLFQDQSLW